MFYREKKGKEAKLVRGYTESLEGTQKDVLPLLLWRDSFLVLDFQFHVGDGFTRFYIKSDRFTGQSLDENLHSSSQSKN